MTKFLRWQNKPGIVLLRQKRYNIKQ